MKGNFIFKIILSLISLTSCQEEINSTIVTPIDKIVLGKKLFEDKNLSNPVGQACVSCHNSNAGFTDPNHNVVTEGIHDGLFGNRNSPMAAYNKYTPTLQYDTEGETYVGGLFLDGAANTLEEQAKKPFLNPLEMNNTNLAMLINKIQQANYYELYKTVYGKNTNPETIFNNITDAIAAYERSDELNPFTSKFDLYLKGQATLTTQEKRGLDLFNDDKKGNCAACHPTIADADSGKILLTDFTYDNIGIPKNPNNPFYTNPTANNPKGANAIDNGLGTIVNDPNHNGKFKVPSLRNVAITAPYGHNGFFNTLEEIVHFYNKRDVESFPTPEVTATVNHDELGNLKLTLQEEKDIVAFMKTLTDGH